jgi:phosphoglycerate dehydrogenase-like enzyme
MVLDMKSLLLLQDSTIDLVFAPRDLDRIARLGALIRPGVSDEAGQAGLQEAWLKHASDADTIITGWGSIPLTADRLASAPNVKFLAHAAGSVRPVVTQSVWDRKIRVFSANHALAIGVAETTLGLIITGLKGVFPTSNLTRAGGWKRVGAGITCFPVRELFDVTIGIIGVGAIGRYLISLLKPFEVNVLVYDPFLKPEDAKALGVTPVSLDDLMAQSDVVSLHAPNIPATRNMLSAPQFSKMRDNAIFINTARGALVDEAALINELKTGRIWAFIDVTNPEPPAPDSPFRLLPNVVLTPHIAGSVANGCRRMGRQIATSLEAITQGQPVMSEVTQDLFDRIA